MFQTLVLCIAFCFHKVFTSQVPSDDAFLSSFCVQEMQPEILLMTEERLSKTFLDPMSLEGLNTTDGLAKDKCIAAVLASDTSRKDLFSKIEIERAQWFQAVKTGNFRQIEAMPKPMFNITRTTDEEQYLTLVQLAMLRNDHKMVTYLKEIGANICGNRLKMNNICLSLMDNNYTDMLYTYLASCDFPQDDSSETTLKKMRLHYVEANYTHMSTLLLEKKWIDENGVEKRISSSYLLYPVIYNHNYPLIRQILEGCKKTKILIIFAEDSSKL